MPASRPGTAARPAAVRAWSIIFASWCVPCIAEAPVLAELKRARRRHRRDRGPRPARGRRARSCADYGDPYRAIGADPDSASQIALGSSGVPESFIVDGRGIIRYQHIGPIAASDMPAILAELEAAR